MGNLAEKLFDLYMAILAAKKLIKLLKPGQELPLDIPDVAFGISGVRYDITEVVIKRAE